MATDAYDSISSNSQSTDEERARIEAEIEGFDDAFRTAQSSAAKLHNLAKALVLNSKSALGESFGASARIDMVDEVNTLRHFLECACLGAGALGDRRERDAIQTVIGHVIDGLGNLSEDLHPGRAEPEAA